MRGFLQRLKVSQKLALISVFFLIPDSVLLCLFLFSINDNIRFASQERHGLEFQRPLESLLEAIPAHHLAELQRRLDPTAAPANGDATIESALQELEAVNGRLGVDLQFTDEGLAKRSRQHCRVNDFRGKWSALAAAASGLSDAELDERHRRLVAELRTMITHTGDNSNLILDPDLDSYYVMDVTLLALPQMQERLWSVTAFAAAALHHGTLSAAERQQLAVFAALLQESDFDRVLLSAETAMNEDPNFYGTSPTLAARIRPALESFRAANEDFIGLIRQLGKGAETAPGVSELLRAGERARATSFVLWRVAAEELDNLLETRTDHYRTRRGRSLILSALALLAAVSLVSLITHSISGPLQRQSRELSLSNAALRTEVQERNRAEEALRAAEERYRTIFENAGEGIFQTSPDGAYLVANPTLARMYGYASVAELQAAMTDISRRLYVDAGRRAEFQRQIALTDRISGFESQVFRKDGTIIWISERARVVRGDNGHVLYYEGTVEDVTERKAREAEVERLHRELIETSRLAGMAEIATGVLHSVGNVLNSVNVATSGVRDRLARSRVCHLRKTAELLGQHRERLGDFLTSDPRGQAVPGFLDRLTGHLEDENRTLVGEMDSVACHIEHLKQIVSTQQSHARLCGLIEPVSPPVLVEEALKLTGEGLSRHGIQVVRDLAATPPVLADRHKALQILVNLLRNAKQAITEQNPHGRQIGIKVIAVDDAVQFTVTDNGIGMDTKTLARLFQHGFTTKRHGHGFGLHSSILAAREMNGDLNARSDGPGRGASFTFSLPITPAA